MNFHEERFPTNLSLGAAGGPERRTEIVTLVNGFEERNTPWAASRRRLDAGLSVQSLDDVATVIAFFEARRGQLYGFRWKDWSDFKTCLPSEDVSTTDQELGQGDGTETAFQLIKAYRAEKRELTKPVQGTVQVAVGGVALVEGVDFSVDGTTGTVTLTTPPAIGVTVTAGCEFDVPVRFDTDQLAVSVTGFDAGEIPVIPVIEVRV